MDDKAVRVCERVARTCEDIRAQLAAWAPLLLGVHVRDRPHGTSDVALLVNTVADAADCTILPGESDAARRELRGAAVRATRGADEPSAADVRAELVAVRAGCRRAAVALGVRIPIKQGSPAPVRPANGKGGRPLADHARSDRSVNEPPARLR